MIHECTEQIERLKNTQNKFNLLPITNKRHIDSWDDETHNPDVLCCFSLGGLTPFIFVPFDQVIAFLFGEMPQSRLLT